MSIEKRQCEYVCERSFELGCARNVGETALTLSIGEKLNPSVSDVYESRPYQLDAWRALYEARANGSESALVHLATGLGKTTVAVIDALRYIQERTEGVEELTMPRILFAVHQNEILEQAADRFATFAPHIPRGFYNDRSKDIDEPIVFGTMQSLYESLGSIERDHFDYIIYDEAHHTQASTYSEVVKYFQPSFQLALTATPDRMDGLDIRELFGQEVYKKTLAEALVQGWLADVDYHIVFDDAVNQAIATGFESQSIKSIKELLANQSRNAEIADQIRSEITKLGLESVKTIVFCQSIAHAEEMAEVLGGKAYHSDLNNEERMKVLESFKSGDLDLITTRDMFNEGVDVPDARLLVFLRSTGSKTIFEQQLGRGLRKTRDKSTVSVLDFVANIERLEHIRSFGESVDSASRDTSSNASGLDSPISEGDDRVLKIVSAHGEFEFSKLVVSILSKLDTARRFDTFKQYSNDDIVELALSLSPGSPLTVSKLKKLSDRGEYPYREMIVNRFGSMAEFHEACGFEVEVGWNDISDQELVELALLISPDEPLRDSAIRQLSKKRDFPSSTVLIKRFGSIKAFQGACGFDTTSSNDITTDELIRLAQQLSPDKPLDLKAIKKLSKAGEFPSQKFIYARFDSLNDFHRACGFDVVDWEKASNELIIETARRLSPQQPMSQRAIRDASKSKEFPSPTLIVNRFGSLPNFQKACGFTPNQKN